MKTLKRNDEIIRVKEEQVDSYLAKGFTFTNKKEWKNKVRDFKAEEPKKDKEDKVEKEAKQKNEKKNGKTDKK